MAYPAVQQVKVTPFASATTTHNVSMPDTVAAGDLLLALFTNDGSATVTTPSGWTPLAGGNQGTAVRFSIYGKDAVGDEDGTTVDFVTSATEEACAQVYRIDGWGGDLLDHVSISPIFLSSGTTTPDPRMCGAPWHASKNTLWIACYGADDDDDVSAYPTNYANNQTYTEASGSGVLCSMASATRNNSVASEDPGAFTIAASEECVAFTIAVAPSDVADAVGDGFPQVVSGTVTAVNANQTQHLVQMPATVAAGDLLLTGFCNDGTSTVTTPSGWTLLDNVITNSAANLSIYGKDADGSEDGTTVDFVTSANQEASAVVLRILADSWDGTLSNVAISADATGTSTTPDPGSVSAIPGSANNLYVTFYGQDAGYATDVPTAVPTGYDNMLYRHSSNSAADGVQVAAAQKFAASASDDAGAWTLSASEDWAAYTVAVPPPAAVGGGTETGWYGAGGW